METMLEKKNFLRYKNCCFLFTLMVSLLNWKRKKSFINDVPLVVKDVEREFCTDKMIFELLFLFVFL